MGLSEALAAVVVERKAKKGESKHYIPFNNKEWEILEKSAGRQLEPKDLKAIIMDMAKDSK